MLQCDSSDTGDVVVGKEDVVVELCSNQHSCKYDPIQRRRRESRTSKMNEIIKYFNIITISKQKQIHPNYIGSSKTNKSALGTSSTVSQEPGITKI